jgi:hypothetical protein
MFKKICFKRKAKRAVFRAIMRSLKENTEAWEEGANCVFYCKIHGPTMKIKLHLFSCDVQIGSRTFNFSIFSKGEDIIRLLLCQ